MDISGYLPTAIIVREGGYEDRGLFGPVIGWLPQEIETIVVEAIRKLAKRAGRQLPNKK